MPLTLEELGHPQPPTPIHVDNSTTVGIVNNTIKRQKSRSMEMRYFWLLDGKVQKLLVFNIIQVLRTLQITLARVIREHIIRQYEIIICIRLLPQDF
eukprot:CCRYP_020030-RA/>CCRYP_020030-RA protein AED:0.46 eAED:0.57 QI:0/-1/0/1/-1/0/1/0/96